MVKVECDGCKAPYQIDERRIPPTGLKMRCPKCGTNLLVQKPAGDTDLPALPDRPAKGLPGAPPAARPGPPRPPPPKAPPQARPSAPPDDGPDSEDHPKTKQGGFGDRPPPARPPPPPAAKPPGPPPRAPAPQAKPIDVIDDLEPEDEFPKTKQGGFGEIDLMVDLPAPVGQSEEDLPAVRGAPPRAPAAPPLQAGGYGEADLPAVHGGHAGLPAVPAGRSTGPRGAPPGAPASFGEIDLPPAPPGVRPPAQPKVRGRTVNFGDIDLPSVPLGADLPLPVEGRGFGEIDLPLVSDDGSGLPMHAQGAGLPMHAQGAGLPMHAQGAGLPMHAQGAGLPMAQGAGLPMHAQGSGLPMPAMGAGLPAYAPGGLPMPAQAAGYPMAAPGAGLPMPAMGGGLPMAVQGGGLPMPAMGQGYPVAVPGGGLPAVPDADALAFDLPPVPPGTVGDEAQLGGASRPAAFDDSDRAVPAQMDGSSEPLASGIDVAGAPRAAVGDEADLALDGSGTPGEAGAQPQRRTREAEAKPKRANARKAAVAAGVLLALGGAALTLVPSCGPFGFYFVSDQINAKSYAGALDALEKDVSTQLDEDTFTSAGAAIDRCRAARTAMPRYRPAAGYCAMIATERGLRFGQRSEDEAFAKQLLASAAGEGGDPALLAVAALDALGGQTDKARGPVQAAAQKPGNPEAAVLLGYVELLAKTHEKDAVAAWKLALGQKKTARTQFGMARALALAGDAKGAEAAALLAIAASHQHAGARILIASLIWTDSAREGEALKLLKEVTDPGAVSKAAGEAEMVEAFTLLGRVHLNRSRITAAEQAFAAALKIDPLAVGALVGNGELFYRSGRYAEALSRYDAAQRADADSVLAKVGTAKTWIALERAKEAQDLLKKVRETHASDPLVALWIGRAAEALGNKKDAEAAYVEAIKVAENKPEAVDAYVALAHLLSGVGRNDDANAKLAEASKKFPDLPALHRAKGEVALQMGRYDEARQELEAALAKDEDLGTRFKLGVAYRRMHRFDEAGAIFDKVATTDKDFPGLALERGLLFEETNQTDKAEKAYSDALLKAPNDVDLKLRVGSTQVMGGHYEKAEKILLEVRKERPNSAEANHFLGRALLMKGGTNVAEAMRFLEQAVNIDPNRAEYHLYVGWAANELNQPAKASSALNKAIDLDHELGDAYWQRGVLLQKQGTSKDALRDLQTALEKRPSRYEANATMALCFQDLQRWADADRAWRLAIAGDDGVAAWHYHLGKLLAGHGGAAASGGELEKAIELSEKGDSATPAWLADAHFLVAESLRAKDKAKAIEHYNRFIELAPNGNAYITEAQKDVTMLGGTPVQR